MVMARRYKDKASRRRGRPGWIVWPMAVVLLLVTIVSAHALLTAIAMGREDWWLGLLALLITLVAALRLAVFRRQSNAR
jgi:hypothetical protein